MASKFYATDSDFFQVVKETKTFVTVRPVTSKHIATTEIRSAFDYDQLFEAQADSFTTTYLFDGDQKRCKKQGDGSICINSYWGVYAWPSTGREEVTRDLR